MNLHELEVFERIALAIEDLNGTLGRIALSLDNESIPAPEPERRPAPDGPREDAEDEREAHEHRDLDEMLREIFIRHRSAPEWSGYFYEKVDGRSLAEKHELLRKFREADAKRITKERAEIERLEGEMKWQ